MDVIPVFYRKIIAGSLTGSLYAIVLGLFVPYPSADIDYSILRYLSTVIISIPAYLMYSFPVIFLYGVTTSILSETFSRFIYRHQTKNAKEVVFSGILHVSFGLVFFIINPLIAFLSVIAAVLFFTVDCYLRKRQATYRWTQALMSLEIPLAVWILFLGTDYLIGLFHSLITLLQHTIN